MFIASIPVVLYLALYAMFGYLPADHFINKSVRSRFLQNSVTKTMFGLNSAGDMRYKYFDTATKKLIVEIDYTNQNLPEFGVEDEVQEFLAEYTGKEVEVSIFMDSKLPDLDAASDVHLRELFDSTKTLKVDAESEYIHIVYTSEYSLDSDKTAIAYSQNEIAVFKKTINNSVTDLEKKYDVEATILKNYLGELLGLSVIERPGCVMSSEFRSAQLLSTSNTRFPITMCGENLVEVEDFKQI